MKLNFAKKYRGRKSEGKNGIIPEKVTKRDCIGQVAEIFDPLGRVTPIVCGMKLDIHKLNTRRLHWDDKIPEDIRQNWVNNFGMIQEISGIRFHRAIVPNDAINLDIETIETADASPCMIMCCNLCTI